MYAFGRLSHYNRFSFSQRDQNDDRIEQRDIHTFTHTDTQLQNKKTSATREKKRARHEKSELPINGDFLLVHAPDSTSFHSIPLNSRLGDVINVVIQYEFMCHEKKKYTSMYTVFTFYHTKYANVGEK